MIDEPNHDAVTADVPTDPTPVTEYAAAQLAALYDVRAATDQDSGWQDKAAEWRAKSNG
jgi:hypothetical protein